MIDTILDSLKKEELNYYLLACTILILLLTRLERSFKWRTFPFILDAAWALVLILMVINVVLTKDYRPLWAGILVFCIVVFRRIVPRWTKRYDQKVDRLADKLADK